MDKPFGASEVVKGELTLSFPVEWSDVAIWWGTQGQPWKELG